MPVGPSYTVHLLKGLMLCYHGSVWCLMVLNRSILLVLNRSRSVRLSVLLLQFNPMQQPLPGG
jgi:hypothetical protein